MSDLNAGSRSDRLDRAIHGLLAQTPEIEAAAVVSFDGLPMASALPPSMDEDRVAAMSAALLSLGERAAQGLGRGELSQVYIEGDAGTVFLISAEDEAVLVAVAAKGAKVGMMLYEVRRAAAVVADVLRAIDPINVEPPTPAAEPAPAYSAPTYSEPVYAEPLTATLPTYDEPLPTYAETMAVVPEPLLQAVPPLPVEAPVYTAQTDSPAWASYAPNGSTPPVDTNTTWS